MHDRKENRTNYWNPSVKSNLKSIMKKASTENTKIMAYRSASQNSSAEKSTIICPKMRKTSTSSKNKTMNLSKRSSDNKLTYSRNLSVQKFRKSSNQIHTFKIWSMQSAGFLLRRETSSKKLFKNLKIQINLKSHHLSSPIHPKYSPLIRNLTSLRGSPLPKIARSRKIIANLDQSWKRCKRQQVWRALWWREFR